MNKIIEPKGRNPRITVCYTPDENQRIIEMASACELKKSQYIHDTSLGQEPKEMMSDREAEALMSLKAARGELILIKNALHQFLLGSRHDVVYHPAPAQFFNKILHRLYVFLVYDVNIGLFILCATRQS